jgi:hypothetical protein
MIVEVNTKILVDSKEGVTMILVTAADQVASEAARLLAQ